jgi:hypothetical protein
MERLVRFYVLKGYQMVEIIMNGGEPLDECPESWDDAHKWIDSANESKNKHNEPLWSFDCGFKLDFDGPLVSVESRFYPPKTHYGPRWDGTCTINLLGNTLIEKKFEADTLDELKDLVEDYIKTVGSKISLT